MSAEIGFNGAIPFSGSTFNTCWGFDLAADHYTAVAGDDVTRMHWYGAKSGPTLFLDVAIYTVTAGLPDVLVGARSTLVITSATEQLHSTGALVISLTAGVTYTICFSPGSSFWTSHFAITAGAGDSDSATTLPAIWTSAGNSSREYRCYADVVNTPPPGPPAGGSHAISPLANDLGDFGL